MTGRPAIEAIEALCQPLDVREPGVVERDGKGGAMVQNEVLEMGVAVFGQHAGGKDGERGWGEARVAGAEAVEVGQIGQEPCQFFVVERRVIDRQL